MSASQPAREQIRLYLQQARTTRNETLARTTTRRAIQLLVETSMSDAYADQQLPASQRPAIIRGSRDLTGPTPTIQAAFLSTVMNALGTVEPIQVRNRLGGRAHTQLWVIGVEADIRSAFQLADSLHEQATRDFDRWKIRPDTRTLMRASTALEWQRHQRAHRAQFFAGAAHRIAQTRRSVLGGARPPDRNALLARQARIRASIRASSTPVTTGSSATTGTVIPVSAPDSLL